ncbi:MAG: radical SAM protein [Clostridia bacterium]|nr:radical SAM protein [Clostridia bacterium]
MAKHKNIPFFIPHSGCKNNCTFCSQTKITGYSLPAEQIAKEAERLISVVDESLDYLGGSEAQIAFFGGSFTGIERDRMLLLLQTAWEYVKKGKVAGIRLSTRPDYIDEEILAILKKYGVTHIELGLQSTDEVVLSATNRGHGRDVCFKNAEMIVNAGFELVGQMMIGLPFSTEEKEIQTAKDIVAMGASAARIYPTVVFEETKLYEQCLKGEYMPLSIEDAVRRSLECLKVFRKADVEILRIGLHSSEELKNAPYGANHPAVGELVYGEEMYEQICDLIGLAGTIGRALKIYVADNKVSIASGLNGRNKKRLMQKYDFKAIKIFASGKDEKLKVKIEAEE